MGTWTTARWPRSRSPRRWRQARPSTCRSPGRRACRGRSRARERSATTTSSAQWFPKIGVFEDTGWNCHQFHAATEFFSDFGIYDVRLTVPSGWIVGATGIERARRDEGDRTTTHHYYAEDVHDFAWTTSPDYVERVERFGARGPAGRVDAPAAPARARPPGGAALQRDPRRAPLLRRVVRPVSLREHHRDRPRLAERRRRHGVSDALHRGHALAGAADGRASRRA